jgi:GTPase
MLIDHAKIYVDAGSGGKGCNSFFKDIFHRKGIPDGGPGGDGGDVIIQSDPNLNTLLDFKYNQHHRAERGGHGGSNHKFGRRGKDLVIKVPAGTIIIDGGNSLVIRDLSRAGERVKVAKGGAGGKGNSKGRISTEGETGESKTIILELKLVADAGIIGFPNAGKSTLVSKISKAHSKIAPYPFTTKSPKLGVVVMGDEKFVVADMPGLIEGAHAGKGLGDRFLRHIERTSVLVHVVDVCPFDGSDPADNFRKLEEELRLYASDVYEKPRIIVANKMDMPGSSEKLAEFRENIKTEVFPVSGLTGEGLKSLIPEIHRKIQYVKKKSEEDNDKDRDESPYREQ